VRRFRPELYRLKVEKPVKPGLRLSAWMALYYCRRILSGA